MTCEACLTREARWTARRTRRGKKPEQWVVCDGCRKQGIRYKTAIRYRKLDESASGSGTTES